MDNTYSQEYIEERMEDFRAFADAVYVSKENKDMSLILLAILYISMKRVK